jgi:thioredoxin-dependent peroxiredoxin
MSKKSRKKSPKTPPRQSLSAKSAKAKKTKSAKSRRTAAKSTKRATARPSHKAASKRLTSSTPAERSKPKAAPSRPAIVDKKPPALSSASSPVSSPILAEGAKAPAFDLPRDGGGSVSLADFAGRKLVLFFYPRADTPGCTRESIDFTRLSAEFEASGTAVLGVSADTVKAQEKFRDKHELSVPLLSDEKHEMLEAYGAWGEKSLYGRTFQGIIRTTILVGTDGHVARIWRHVKVDGHADAVLAAARALGT